ncbi:G-D-S-L family lipolytic protein [Flavobacterium sp.]|uniref:G-D-S-L family lipolytic protein n=1 Tax=Flavobacterium sp. TaxID=239 RepID=UPI0038D05E47
MIKNIKWLFLVSLTFVACSKNDEVITDANSSDGLPLTSGSANFSKYVALGNSLTSGYSDGALFIEGQKGAYPALLAEKFALVGGGSFSTPFMADNVGGFKVGGTVASGPRLYYTGNQSAPLAPVSGTPSTEILNHLTGPFNNMGVPGAKSFHLLSNTYGNPAGIGSYANPYFVRFASSSSATVLGDAVAQNPTFFSLWIGNNDVLSYATSGGTGVNQTGNTNPATYGPNDITDPTAFASVYSNIVNGLTANGAKGVVANIPYVTSVPFFTTVPTNPIPGLPAASAAQLNQLFGAINQITTTLGQPNRFSTIVADDNNPATTEKNPLLINDESLPNLATYITGALTPALGATTAAYVGNLYGRARHAKDTGARDYILLTAQTVIGTTQSGAPAPFNTVGVSYPMQDSTTLTASETAEVVAATDAYNSSIQSIANTKGLAFVNANAVMAQVANGGVSYNGFNFTSTFVTGNAFSLDGVHPSPKGYALIANKFIEAINAKYGSNLKGPDVGNYRTLFPASL